MTRWTLAWYAEVKEEYYVSHWASGYGYIGDWHPIYCAWGWIAACSSAGVPAWYNAYAGGTHHVAYWPAYNWGPVWQQYWYPVWAKRWVVTRLIPYWAPDWSSAAVLTIFESGGAEVYEHGDWDDNDLGDDDGVYFVRAAAKKPPPCQRINRKIVVGGLGSGNLRFRYCWNRTRKKVSLDSQFNNHVDADLSTLAAVAHLGSLKVDDERFSPEVLSLHGSRRGALDGHGHFAFKAQAGLGPFSVEKTVSDVDWGVIARYTGSWCPYYKFRRQQNCGVG